jgi:hypothetical protein
MTSPPPRASDAGAGEGLQAAADRSGLLAPGPEAAPLGAAGAQRPGAEGAKSGNTASFDLSAAQPPRMQP